MIRRLASGSAGCGSCRSRSPDRQPASGQLPQPRMELRDLFSEAAAGLMARPARVAPDRARHGDRGRRAGGDPGPVEDRRQPDRRAGSTQVAATDVVVTPVPAAQRAGGAAVNVIPWDAEARMKRLNGVAQAGTLARGERARRSSCARCRSTIRSGPDRHPASGAGRIARAVARPCAPSSSPDGCPTRGHSARGDRVAVLGINAARRLGITNLDQQPAIFIGDRLYQVIGLVGGVGRQVSLLGSLTIPNGTARREFGARRRPARCRSRPRSARSS